MTLLARVPRRGPPSVTAKCNLTCRLQEAFMHLGRGHTNSNAISTAYFYRVGLIRKALHTFPPAPTPLTPAHSFPFSANIFFSMGKIARAMKGKMSPWLLLHCGRALREICLEYICLAYAGRAERNVWLWSTWVRPAFI